MARVGLGAVFRESVALCRFRARFLAGMLAVTVALVLPFLWVRVVEPPSSALLVVLMACVLLFCLVATALQVSVFHTLITTLRGQDAPIVLAGLIPRTLRTLLAELKVALVVIIPGALMLLLTGFITVFLLTSEDGAIAYPLLAAGISSFGLFAVGGWFSVRLGAGIASAAVGERLSFKDSWRMTRGHSLALLVSVIPFAIVPQLGFYLLGGGQSMLGSGLSTGMLANLLVNGVVYMFTYAVLSVWYVRLKERYDAEREAAAAVAEAGHGAD